MSKRPKQFYRVDKDAVEISQAFGGNPITLEVLPLDPERLANPYVTWENDFRVSCTLFGVYIEGTSNYIDGAIANLHAKLQENLKKSQQLTKSKE